MDNSKSLIIYGRIGEQFGDKVFYRFLQLILRLPAPFFFGSGIIKSGPTADDIHYRHIGGLRKFCLKDEFSYFLSHGQPLGQAKNNIGENNAEDKTYHD